MAINSSKPLMADSSVEHVRLIYAAVGQAIFATIVSSVLLATVLWPVVSHNTLLLWLSLMLLISLVRGLTAYQYTKHSANDEAAAIWFRRFVVGSVFASIGWGAAAVLMFPENDAAHQVFLAFVVGGMAAGSITSLSYSKYLVYFYLVASLLPLQLRFFLSDTELGLEMAVMLIFYLMMLLFAATRAHNSILQVMSLKKDCDEFNRSYQQSERRYQRLLQTAADAFLLHDENGKFVDVNTQACKDLGYSRNEMLNMEITGITVTSGLQVAEQERSKLEKGETIQFEAVHKRKDGSVFPVEVRIGLISIDNSNFYSILARDVTERKRDEKIIRESQQRMALHVQRTPLGVIEWDKFFCVTEWNQAAETIFGYKKEEVIGRHAKDIIVPDEGLQQVNEVWDNLINMQSGLRSTNENITKDKTTILCDWYNTPLINETGEVIAVASLVQDITSQKNAELAIIRAKEEAEAASKAKSDFLSHMSHEFRTPLTAILGFSQIMSLRSDVPDKYRGYVAEITKAGAHLLELINDVLDLSSIEAGKLSCKLAVCELNGILSDCFKFVEGIAADNDIEIIDEVTGSDNYLVYVDRFRLKQAIINLLTNAIKYNSKQGTVTISCTVLEEKFISINIEDTGSGLTEKEQLRLFKPFERIGKYKGIDGTGIGLMITKRVVEMMGGEVGVESTVGKGSVFWLKVALSSDANVLNNNIKK
ncbi:MAG: PAS domain-containing sensor histidine kinase [Gammaproteobacteria bacterium]|nr:PAS domain-containing sensor histidine kinase [Gammaproteobacteria bacterium]